MKSKSLLLVLSFLMISLTSNISYAQKYKFEQKLTLEELNKIKSSKFYIAVTGNKEKDEILEEVIRAHWTFTEITGTMKVEELKSKIKNGQKVAFIGLAEVRAGNLFSEKSGIKSRSVTEALKIYSSNIKYGDYTEYLTYADFTEENFKASIAASVKTLNSRLKDMHSGKLKSSADLKKTAIARKDVFTKKTLYIPKNWLNNLTENEFKSIYTNKVKFVSKEEFVEVMQTQPKDAIIVLPLAIPAEGGFINTHIFIDVEDWKYLGIVQHLTMGEMATNIFNSYYYTISKPHAKLYMNITKGKW